MLYIVFGLFFNISGENMSIARVTEITASSTKSFDDAIEKGIKRASKTIRNIEGAWIQDQKVIVKKGKISEYRVSMKLSFVLDD
jgi:flavin-binding protein dodecin